MKENTLSKDNKKNTINELHIFVFTVMFVAFILTSYFLFFSYELKTTINNYDIVENNLGKIITLLGFIGTIFSYLITKKGYVLYAGVTISLIAGALVGISSTFFAAGQASFVM